MKGTGVVDRIARHEPCSGLGSGHITRNLLRTQKAIIKALSVSLLIQKAKKFLVEVSNYSQQNLIGAV